jgi:hypothetical protein
MASLLSTVRPAGLLGAARLALRVALRAIAEAHEIVERGEVMGNVTVGIP